MPPVILLGVVILIVLLIWWLVRPQPIALEVDRADLIIVGAGSAGCILARRLSERFPQLQIVVLEQGTNQRDDPHVYNLSLAPQISSRPPYSQVLQLDFPGASGSVGTMYGGSSSHNYGLMVKGSPDFYNGAWRQQLGLSYEQLAPYFARVDRMVGITPLPVSVNLASRIGPALSEAFQEGPGILWKGLQVLTHLGPLRASDSFSRAVTQAIHRSKGVPIVQDYNGPVGACTSETPQMSIDPAVGIRQSTDVTYLPSSYITIDSEGRGRNRNLQLVPHAQVERISPQGVQWNGRSTRLNPGGRIILSAGGIGTPYLLQKSGFPSGLVGRGLKDHYGTSMILEVTPDQDENFDFSSGPLAFVPRTQGTVRDWQLVVNGGADTQLLESIGFVQDPQKKYFSFLLWDIRPRTSGQVRVGPNGPQVDLNLFQDPEDLASITEGLDWMFELADRLQEVYPSLRPVYPPARQDLERYAMAGLSLTQHYSHTCPLGTVVDPDDFSLYGASNIHVVDTSVFPEISDGNTCYPVMVMAEIAADRISEAIVQN